MSVYTVQQGWTDQSSSALLVLHAAESELKAWFHKLLFYFVVRGSLYLETLPTGA